jgi:hypothetical protein
VLGINAKCLFLIWAKKNKMLLAIFLIILLTSIVLVYRYWTEFRRCKQNHLQFTNLMHIRLEGEYAKSNVYKNQSISDIDLKLSIIKRQVEILAQISNSFES